MGAIASRSSSEKPAPGSARGRDGESGKRNAADGGSPLAEVLELLTRVQPGNHRVVTCYLKLEPRDRSRGKYLIKVKNRVKAAVQGLSRLSLERAASEA